MKKILLFIVCAAVTISCNQPQPPAEVKSEITPADTTPKFAEMGDPAAIETGKTLLASLSDGDMDKYLAYFADDAMYYWNNGDSLAGKAAISDFWTDRRNKKIKTLQFENQIWLPVKVNQPQSDELPGNWLLGWAKVNVVYSNDQPMTQWMHFTIHFNDNNKIDQMNHYVDMVPVNKATTTGK